MHKFTYQFIKEQGVDIQLFSLSNIISDANARTELNKTRYGKMFSKLEKIAIKESVEQSNAIEGVFTTSDRLTDIVERGASPIGHGEEEIAGYHDAVKFIKENYLYLDFDEKTIKHLHMLLMERHANYKRAGQYKTSDNIIAEKYPDGRVKNIIFTPTKAVDVQEAMKELCLAYQVARDDADIPSLLLIPCVIVDFLSIHPFQDGNGRVSRLLTLLLLYKAGYEIGKFISFEKQISDYKANYYDALAQSQENWHNSNNTYVPFIRFTFQILCGCYKEINRRLVAASAGKHSLKDRIEFTISNTLVPISKQEILSLVPDASVSTVESVLSSLLKKGAIVKVGDFKNAKYMAK